jgi:hypothetical protein
MISCDSNLLCERYEPAVSRTHGMLFVTDFKVISLTIISTTV